MTGDDARRLTCPLDSIDAKSLVRDMQGSASRSQACNRERRTHKPAYSTEYQSASKIG
jgi:hypothetical protein